MEPMDLIKNPLYWKVASAELAVVTDDSYSGFLYEMIAKIESGIKSMDETGSVSWIVEKFQMSQQNRWS